MSYPSRNQTSRLAASWAQSEAPDDNNLSVDLSGMSDDLEACWITTDVYGQPTDNLVLKAMRRGFRAATKSDCPMACLPDYPGRPKRDENAPITFPGSMLMVRPKAKGEAERNYYRQMNDDQQEAATHRSEERRVRWQ